MSKRIDRRHAQRCFFSILGCLLVAVLVQGILAAEEKGPAGVSGYDCGACVQPPKGKMPILVLTDSQYSKNPFGCYLTEILRSEGLVEFEQAERSALVAAADPAARVSAYDLVVMAEMDLEPQEERLLRGYVGGGGVLLAMRPDADLADLFGIRVTGTRPERLVEHFAVDVASATGEDIVGRALQYHGEATNYSLDGAEPLAYLYDDADTPSSNPAVTISRNGEGRAVAFAFDLAKSVVLMRQGNPAWKDTEGDNFKGYRPMDMFERPDGRTYFDPDLLEIPQADQKQRFLANLILNLAGKPLPRMWYLPAVHKVIVVNTGDGESNYGPQISPVLDASASYGGFFSVYLMNRDPALGIERTTVEEEAAWRAAGHEVGVHVFAGGPEGAGAYDALHKAYGKIVQDLKNKFGHGARTARNHTVDWTGWVDMAAIEARFGTGMDVNYSHFVLSGDPPARHGYFNGTGLPQRFIDAKGRILPIYQATTQWMDQWFVIKQLTADETAEIIIGMLEAAQAGYYSAFVNCIHPCRFTGYGGKDEITPVWPHTVWKYCRDKGIPMWSAEMLLDFVEARNQAQFENITWTIDPKQETRRLTFDFRTPAGGQKLTIMIPGVWARQTLGSVSADGRRVEWTTETIKGIKYGMFTTTEAHLHIVADYQ